MDARMRLAFGQELEQRHQRQEAGKAQRIVDEGAGPERHRLEGEAAEMVLGAGPPARHHDIAGLEHRAHGTRAAAAHQADQRPRRSDRTSAMAEASPWVLTLSTMPCSVHSMQRRQASYSSPIILRRSGSLAQFSLTLTNRNRCTGRSSEVGELLAGRLADPLDGLAALAEHDLALALALDIDGLLDAHRAVLALLRPWSRRSAA